MEVSHCVRWAVSEVSNCGITCIPSMYPMEESNVSNDGKYRKYPIKVSHCVQRTSNYPMMVSHDQVSHGGIA